MLGAKQRKSPPFVMSQTRPPIQIKTGIVRWMLLVAGTLSAALGALGAFLPVLPTTPFLLLAAACFVRSSPSFHRRLLANRLVGPYLLQWQSDRTVPLGAKRRAYGLVVFTFSLSIYFLQPLWLRLTLVGIGLALLLFLICLPTTQVPSDSSVESTSDESSSSRKPA